MKEKLKMIQIREEAHIKAKRMALKREISMKDYVEWLVNDDEELYREEQIKEAKKLLKDLENE